MLSLICVPHIKSRHPPRCTHHPVPQPLQPSLCHTQLFHSSISPSPPLFCFISTLLMSLSPRLSSLRTSRWLCIFTFGSLLLFSLVCLSHVPVHFPCAFYLFLSNTCSLFGTISFSFCFTPPLYLPRSHLTHQHPVSLSLSLGGNRVVFA